MALLLRVAREIDAVAIAEIYAPSARSYRWSVEVSAYVRDAAQRAGIGRALYTSLMAVLVLQGFHNAYAGITLPNESSVAFHKALGFRPVGVYRRIGFKAGAWHDVGWWHRELQPPVEDPAAPRAFVEIRKADACRRAIAAGRQSLAR